MSERSDTELVSWVVSAASGCEPGLPRWSHVAAVFGLGSTSAQGLCRRFDVDPDEIVESRCSAEPEGS